MIEISMQAALLICSICFIIGFVVMLIQYFNKETKKNTLYFLGFFLMSSVGSIMILFRNEINNAFLSVIVANLLLLTANMLLGHGIFKIINYKTKLYYSAIYIFLFISLFGYFTYIDLNVIMRVIVYNVAVIIILLRIIIKLQKAKTRFNFLDELMSPALSLIIFMMLLRVLGLIIFTETTNDFLTFQRDPLNVSLVGVANLLVIAGLLSLMNNLANENLIESERSKTSLLSNLPGFAYRCLADQYWTMLYISDGFKSVTGYEIEDVLNNNKTSYEDIIAPEYRSVLREGWTKALQNNKPYLCEYQITKSDGSKTWVWEHGKGIYDSNNEIVAIEGFIRDINDRKKMETNLVFLSYKDSLTKLYNRRYINDKLNEFENSDKLPISIIVADINGLKFINDSFGHDHGDKIILNVSRVLTKVIGKNQLIGRVGGDEFFVLLEKTTHSECKKLVEKIQREVRKVEYEKLGMSLALGYETQTNSNQKLIEVRKLAEDNMYKQKIYSKPSSRRKAVDAVLKTLFEKDNLSEHHSRNVSKYGKDLAVALGLSDAKINQVETAALLHDVGKIIIDDSILKSSGKLSDDEWNQIKQHPRVGFRIISSVPELEEIAEIILAHHERIDGTGYPNKIKGKDIPYASKIIAVCDAYDAMINKRYYKKTLSKEEAIKELKKYSGTQFDGEIVKAFIKIL